MTTKDPFSVDIVLRHPSQSPRHISKALSLKPEFSHAVDDRVAKLRRRWKKTLFYACLQKGDYASKFESSLTKVVLFLEKNAAFWTDFTSGNGEVELILKHTINPQDEAGDKCFELYLAPAFLRDVSARGIGLRVQGWQGSTEGISRRGKKIGRTKLRAKS
jgi:hypothetical protein